MKKILLSFSLVLMSTLSNLVNAQVIFNVQNPSNIAGNYTFTYADTWGADLTTTSVVDTLEIMTDTLGANTPTNAAALAGKIAVVYRGGGVAFSTKAYNAELAGAVACIIINNVATAPIGMSNSGSLAVTIPVVMIGQADGALLRAAMDAGDDVIAFIGTKNNGFYTNDLGFYMKDVVRARSFAIPAAFAEDSSEFQIPVGAWVYNFGSANQTNVSLSAEVKLNNNSLYSETSAAISLASGDSTFISLPAFAKTSYTSGYYSLDYNISADATPDYTADDSITTNFWINDSLAYSKNTYSQDSLLPQSPTGITSSTNTDVTWCIVLNEPTYDDLAVEGISFSTSTKSPKILTNESIEVQLYLWSDVLDPNAAATFDMLDVLGSAFYDYTSNLQYKTVTANFDSPVVLEDGFKYLACVHKLQDSLYIGADNEIDYSTTADANSEIYAPLNSAGTWYPGGFGMDLSPNITINLKSTVGVKENSTSNKEINVFPNPANSFISIPLNAAHNGKVELNIFDVTGKLVKTEAVSMVNTNLFKVNTTSIENGAYFFQLRFEDKSVSSFSVLISH